MSPQPESLVRMAEHSVRTFADRPVFGERVDGTWSWMTYREVGTQIDELRSGLATIGVTSGDRVAIISRNSAPWAITAYATYGLGATLVPMYEAQRHDEWEFILRDCNASVVFVRTAEIAAAVESMRGALPALQHVITIESPADDRRTFDGLRRLGREHVVPTIYPDPESIAGRDTERGEPASQLVDLDPDLAIRHPRPRIVDALAEHGPLGERSHAVLGHPYQGLGLGTHTASFMDD